MEGRGLTALDHHVEIKACFEAVKSAGTANARRAAQKQLALVLTGVLYPAMALTDQKGHAAEMYTEQSAAKMQMAAL